MPGGIAFKRVSKDLQYTVNLLKANPVSSDATKPVIAFVDAEKEDIFAWKVVVSPGSGSMYGVDGRTYELHVLFSEDYPHEPPTVRFITPVYSPMVTTEGQICEQILARDWTPDQHAYDAIQLVINRVFIDFSVNRDDDINHEARQCLDENPNEFKSRLRR